ncbi:MAG: SMC family ATPase, partial [Fusobacterium sp.]|nr:SMC family ATPase [Fusobacterium sp.]
KRAELKSIVANKKKSEEIIDKLKKENILKANELNLNTTEIKENISSELEEKNKKISVLENELKIYQSAFNTYLENINIAKDFKNTLNSLNKTIKSIYSLKNEVKNLFIEKEKIEKIIGKISVSNLKEEFQKINFQIINYNSNLGKLSVKIKNFESELEILRNEKEKLKLLSANLKKIENKLYKTKQIRNNMKSMGLKISKYMLESISLKATENFRKITGRSERILWTNEIFLENGKEIENKYAVYLASEDRKISFEHLSGGEQVAVAISLRETMTEFFSNSRFIILDEPTNNLDTERKKLLAEYMGEILNNLDQSIIVTHDNTFREMAERIIEL